MSEQPSKRLSLKTKADAAEAAEDDVQTRRRSKKRIIKRDELPASRLSNAKQPPAVKPKLKKRKNSPKRPVASPSAIRMDNLNASLNAFEVWRNLQPLALGIEKQIFQHVAKHQLSCSKRVVQRLLRQHTRDKKYLQAVISGSDRFNLDGSEAQPITQTECDHAKSLQGL